MQTHKEITSAAAKWLKKHKETVLVPNCPTVAEELNTASATRESPDVIGWCYWTSILIEVKTSRADFLKDKKKPFRKFSQEGMGEFRYYLCPTNLINEKDLPSKWGLLYIDPSNKINIIKKAERADCNLGAERTVLLSIIRRS